MSSLIHSYFQLAAVGVYVCVCVWIFIYIYLCTKPTYSNVDLLVMVKKKVTLLFDVDVVVGVQ